MEPNFVPQLEKAYRNQSGGDKRFYFTHDANMAYKRDEPDNWATLERYWRRRPFHDMLIESVSAHRGRVVIRLEAYILIVTRTSELKRCELPAVWLYESVKRTSGGRVLDVETDTGHLVLAGTDVRLIRNGDFAILVPPIDN